MQIENIGIIGLGYMGSGIAACLLHHDMRLIAFTSPNSGFVKARQAISAAVEDLITHKVASDSLRDKWPSRYVEVESISAMTDCDFIIETVTEDIDIKQSVYQDLEKVVRPEVVIATNTSGFPITLLQQGMKHPGRFIGMHWCPPCHVNPLLEIIPGQKTDQATVDTTMQLAAALDKEPGLLRKDIEGFIVNRLGYALYREALHLLDLGIADAATIDRVFQNAIGMYSGVVGPLRWMDLTGGLHVYAKVMQKIFPTLDNTAVVPHCFHELLESGAEGSGYGRGFYNYGPNQDPQWQQLLTQHMWNMIQLRKDYSEHFPEITT